MSSEVSSGILSNPHLKVIAQLFTDNGFTIRLVGGVVRDMILNVQPNNINLATDATPGQVKNLLKNFPTIKTYSTADGRRRATVSAVVERETVFQITTLKINLKTDERHAGDDMLKNWKLDASKRDFTINSMFMNLDGEILDFFNGQKDLENGIIRFVGNPVDRINEDYLRIFRYFRFYCRYGKQKHLKEVRQAIKANLKGLYSLPGEKMWSEVKKILSHKDAYDVVSLMIVRLGIGRYMGFNINIAIRVEEFYDAYQNLLSMGSDFEPSTLFSSVIGNLKKLRKIAIRLNLSEFERSNMHYLLERRAAGENSRQPCSIKDTKMKLAMAPESEQETCKKYMLEFLKYTGRREVFTQFLDWKAPHFPFDSTALGHSNEDPHLIACAKNFIKRLWAVSGFEMSAEKMKEQFEKEVERSLRLWNTFRT